MRVGMRLCDAIMNARATMNKGIANDASPMLCAKRQPSDLFAMEIVVPSPFQPWKIATSQVHVMQAYLCYS
jgi:hypothetical protein